MKSKASLVCIAALMRIGLSHAAPELDENGCRKLSTLPPPGVHPRLFFTADKAPRLKARLNTPE